MFDSSKKISYFWPPVSPIKSPEGKVLKQANQTPNGARTLFGIYQTIVGEGEWNPLPELTKKLREISDPDPKREHDLGGEFKKRELPFVTFGGEFSYRKSENLTTPSGLVCIDIDGKDQDPPLTEDDIPRLRQALSEDSELDPVLLFCSPLGKGLKIVVNVRQDIRDDSEYKRAYKSLENYLRQRHHLVSDPQRKDINGACFLCYDPGAIMREPGEGFDVDKWVPQERPQTVPSPVIPSSSSRRGDEPSDYERALVAVEDIERAGVDITWTRDLWRQVGFALSELGESGRELFHRVSQFYPKYNRKETDYQFDSFLKGNPPAQKITLKSLFYLAKDAGVPLRPSDVYSRPQKEPKSGARKDERRHQSTPPVEAQERPGNEAPDFSRLLLPTSESEIIERGKQRPPSLTTGYIIGGHKLRLLSGKLTEVAGATGHGKTLLLMNLLLNVSRLNPDKRFILFTYEEDEDTIVEYLLNIYLSDLNLMKPGESASNRVLLEEYFTGQGTGNFNPKKVEEFHRRKNLFFSQYIETGRILIKYVDSDSRTLCRQIRHVSEPGNNLGGIFVDYFQYINPDPEKRYPTRQEALKNICIELKDVAKDIKIPVILACQFNQEVLSPTDVLLNKIGESGDISRIGSECWGLWQMNKDIGRELKGDDKLKVDSLKAKTLDFGVEDKFLSGMYLRILKSRIIETGAEELLRFRGLTGKIYPNDPDERDPEGRPLSVEEWDDLPLM